MELDLRYVESACRIFLANAASRLWAANEVRPEAPSVDYVTGFAAGRELAEVEAFALILSMVTGESATRLAEEAKMRAAVDSSFPFDLHIEPHLEPHLEPPDGAGVPRPDPAAGLDAA